MPDAPKYPAPFSLRLTQEERERLARDAVGMSLGSYIRWRLFDPSSPPPRNRGKFPVKDHVLLGRVFAVVARFANNLNQVAKLAHRGALPVTPETNDLLQAASRANLEIRSILIEALGLEDRKP